MSDKLVTASESLLGAVLNSAKDHITENECRQFRNRVRNRISQLKLLNSASRKKVIEFVKKEIGESFGHVTAKEDDLERFVNTADTNAILRLMKINCDLPNEVMTSDVRTSLKNLMSIIA